MGGTLRRMSGRLGFYISDYKHVFKSKTKHFFDKAPIYCHGIFMSEPEQHRKNKRRDVCQLPSDAIFHNGITMGLSCVDGSGCC